MNPIPRSLVIVTLALGATIVACESAPPPMDVGPGLSENDAAVIAALEYVVDLERRTTVYQGDRAFELGESVFVRFMPQRPDGPRWSPAVEEVAAARGWTVVRDDPKVCLPDRVDFYGDPVCRLPGADADQSPAPSAFVARTRTS